jgi:hypothetical protein
MYCSHINEFAVASDFPLRLDAQARSSRPAPEMETVTIRRASLAHIPCTLRKICPQFIYDVGNGFLLEPRAPNRTPALHIDLKGRVITIDCSDEQMELAAAWAIHAGLGAATLTHGGVPLHGAGLEIKGRYIALMADSGTGKSTLSWFLMQRGARFGNDDLIPVRMVDDEALAFPAVSLYPKLQREAVDRHGLSVSDLLPADYGTGEEEYYVPLPLEKRVTAPAPLAAAFLLRPQRLTSDKTLSVRRMSNLVNVDRLPEDEAAKTLRQNLHAVWLIGKWMDGRKLDALCRQVAARVPVYTLTYPRAYALLPTLAETIREAIGTIPSRVRLFGR